LNKKEIIKRVTELVTPIVKDNNVELVETEYVKEGKDTFLRIYIDKRGGIGIDDCESVSRELEKHLDDEDFIETAYHLEVSSPGLTRPLTTDADFKRYEDETVIIKLYKKIDGKKEYEGTLKGINNGNIIIENDENEYKFIKEDVASVKRAIKF
jgi:ribosome maturation factor RimP